MTANPQPQKYTLSDGSVRWKIHYRTHDGLRRPAYVVLPQWYGPENNPALPLVISPHGRGVGAAANVRRFGNLPTRGGVYSE